MSRWAWLLVGCVGCQSWMPRADTGILAGMPSFTRAQDGASESEIQPARKAQSAAIDGADIHMAAAAELFEQGDPAAAAVQLAAYVAERPEHLSARAQLGELLFRGKKLEEARKHFEQFIEEAQAHPEAASRHLLHSHARLTLIAEAREDAYEEPLHRGIGLYLLACRLQEQEKLPELPSAESLLFRAAAALQQARDEQPDQARPHFYLYKVWSCLNQQQAAKRSLDACDVHAVCTSLTPAERRELQTACMKERLMMANAR